MNELQRMFSVYICIISYSVAVIVCVFLNYVVLVQFWGSEPKVNQFLFLSS